MNAKIATQPTAIAYARWSTPDQESGDSQKRQDDLVQAYCLDKGLALLDTRIDKGVSAFRSKNSRKGKLALLMDDLKSKRLKVDYILVESFDRFSRDAPFDARQLVTEIINTGVAIVTLSDRQVYSRKAMRENPVLSIMMDIIMMRSRDESIMKMMRAKGAWRTKRENASKRPMSANGPAWLDPIMETQHDKVVCVGFKINEKKADAVRSIYKFAAQGLSIERIAKNLNDMNIKPITNSAFWYRNNVSRIINSKAVVGIMQSKTVDYVRNPDDDVLEKVKTPAEEIPNYFPAVVDRVTANKVWALNENRSAFKATGKPAFITSSLAKCVSCGKSMTYNTKGVSTKNRYIVCAHTRVNACSDKRLVKYNKIEAILVNELFDLLEQHSIKGEDTDVTAMKTTLDDIEAEIGRLIDAIRIEGHTASLGTALNRLDRDRKRLIAELSEASQKPSLSVLQDNIENLKGSLMDGSSIPEINQAMRLVFSGIVIDWHMIELTFLDGTRAFISY